MCSDSISATMIKFSLPLSNLLITFSLLLLLILPVSVYGECPCECPCDVEEGRDGNKKIIALPFKIGAIFSILFLGITEVCIPVLSKIFPAFQPGKDLFFMIKAFAAGVILATGFIHILPDAFGDLTSPCLNKHPWGKFPFAGFVSMLAAIGTLLVDTLATSYYNSRHFNESLPAAHADAEVGENLATHVHVHSHATNGHAHGSDESASGAQLIRHRIISQVLELGIVVHSVIIGISLGVTDSSSTAKTLLIALSFHQFFEGMGLGGCISQAKFKGQAVVVMALFFALTTPVGIAIGIVISKGYKENSPTAHIVEGVLNSASAGTLIYMALVDLLAADFTSAKIQGSVKLMLQVFLFLLVGAGLMSVLAYWA